MFDSRMGGVFQVNGIKKLFSSIAWPPVVPKTVFIGGYDAQGGRRLSRTILTYKGSNDDSLLNLNLFPS